MGEQAVAAAALDALKTWTNQNGDDEAKTMVSSPSIHPEVRLIRTNGGAIAIAANLPPAKAISVDHVQIVSVGLKNAAQAKVSVDETAGFLVLLYLEDRWQCISGAIGAVARNDTTPIAPNDIMEVTRMVWDGYCDANGRCQGDLMKRYFHDKCRLTYAMDSRHDGLRILDCDSFCHMVTHRYAMDAHRPYEHWKDLARDKTTLISVDFATPELAMVMLKIGHPPFLWTDLLTCMKIDTSEDQDDDTPSKQWWIVHKSSCHEDYFPPDSNGEPPE